MLSTLFINTPKDISNAIEYTADNVPTLILAQENGSKMFMGGYKAAINCEFLRKNEIELVICAAKDLEKTFGPKYQKLVEKRSQTLPQITVKYHLSMSVFLVAPFNCPFSISLIVAIFPAVKLAPIFKRQQISRQFSPPIWKPCNISCQMIKRQFFDFFTFSR